MNRKRIPVLLAVFFVLQIMPLNEARGSEFSCLNPPSRIDQITLKQISSEENVLFEMTLTSPSVICQVLPNVNEILKNCSIKPHEINHSRETASSS